MTDDLTDDTIWIQGARMPWFDTRLNHLKKEKYTSYICFISYMYIIYLIYCIYMKGEKCVLYI